MVREGCERIEAEHGSRALQCVEASKDLIDQGSVARFSRQIEQALLDPLKQLGCLGAERCNRIVIGGH